MVNNGNKTGQRFTLKMKLGKTFSPIDFLWMQVMDLNITVLHSMQNLCHKIVQKTTAVNSRIFITELREIYTYT